MKVVGRRVVLATGLSLPAGLTLTAGGCAPKPTTPLAHLYGDQWVHGAYELYGDSFGELERAAHGSAMDAYRVLAGRGIGALDGLQEREVPFFIRAQPDSGRFGIQRTVPERLTYTADMSEEDRAAAKAAWERARENIQRDYEEVRTLEWALSELLGRLVEVRSAMEKSREEQFRLTRQLREVGEGSLPYELPYQVKPSNYASVVAMLVARLEDERARLAALESAVVSVGLTVRATDAGSASLASNLRKVLLGVVHDAEGAEPDKAVFPSEGDRQGVEKRGRALAAEIEKSPEYAAWLKREREAELDQIGAFLSVLDQVTGLPTSAVFKQAVTILSGDADYLDYLKLAASIAPHGSEISSVMDTAVTLTSTVRSASGDAARLLAAAEAGDAGVLLNHSTSYARRHVNKQLAFYESAEEADQVAQALAAAPLMSRPMPKLR
jgi:hypothetical protein